MSGIFAKEAVARITDKFYAPFRSRWASGEVRISGSIWHGRKRTIFRSWTLFRDDGCEAHEIWEEVEGPPHVEVGAAGGHYDLIIILALKSPIFKARKPFLGDF